MKPGGRDSGPLPIGGESGPIPIEPSGRFAIESSGRYPLARVDAVARPSFPRRFRTRVFLYVATLSLATSIGSAAIYYTRQLGFIHNDRTRRAKTLLTSLATQAELGAYAGDAALCDLAARRTFNEDDVLLAAIYDRKGKQILRFAAPALTPPPPPSDLVGRMTANPEAKPERFDAVDASGERYDDLYAPIVTGVRDTDESLSAGPGKSPRLEVVGIARVGLSLRPAAAQLDEVVRWGFYLACAIFVVGLLAAYLISRAIARPIAALTRSAEELRAGVLDTRVEVESKDEIGQLAFSFNRMAARLRESITALETLNRDLEAEVARRTAEIQRAAAFSTLLNAPLGEKSLDQMKLLDDALAALVEGTGATAAAALLTREEAVDFELATARIVGGGDAASFGAPPAREALQQGAPFLDGDRLIVPLVLGDEPEGCVILKTAGAVREDQLRFARGAAAQLSIAVGNVRAYDASAHLARELKERNQALAKQRDQLSEMNRLKSEFLANISHELRTPLNAIIGYAELITDGIYGDVTPEQKTALAGVDESGKNLLALINQILDLSKVEAGKMTVHVEEVDLGDVVRAVIAETLPLTKDKPYKAQLLTMARVRLRTDGSKVKQIITNLVSNAIKFTARGRVDVTIRAEPSGGCTIAVKDTGIGIRAEDMQIIFEEFRQVDGSYTRTFGGTGLGLAIAKRFANLLGGSITVESKVGLGSTFTLHLPKEPPTAQPPPRERRPTIPPPVPAAARREVKPS